MINYGGVNNPSNYPLERIMNMLREDRLQYYDYITEGVIMNQPDIYYNKDKFDSGDINLCFILGHSGSGKPL